MNIPAIFSVPLRSAIAAFALLAVVAVSGCVETRFESPLGDNIESCDVHWKGLWIGDEPEKASDGANHVSAFQVDDECRFLVLDQVENGGPLKPIHVPLNYVHDRGNDYLVVSDAQIKGLVEIPPPYAIEPKPEKSFYFARYRVRGDRIELYDVDSEKVAKLVIDAKAEGTINKTGTDLHVYVRGNRAQMLELVRKYPIFVDKASVLVRSNQSVEDFEKSLIARQRKARKP
ncbi:MAG: hypothetical protein ABI411_03015 [Tahibacter sp.]